jgi:hypothetical protein
MISIRIYKDIPLGGKSMAYCPKCKKNYPIVTSTKDSPRGVLATTERYNSEGDYIGYEETYGVNTEMIPRCSNCYSVFEFPNAISKEEFFYAKRNKLLKILRSKKTEKKEIEELKSLTYSDENYERVVTTQISPLSKGALERHKEVWRRIKLAKARKAKND